MCYSGKCKYENYMGDCTVANPTDKTCKEGNRIYKIEIIKNVIKRPFYQIQHVFKLIFNKEYRKWWKDNELPF